ncbi:hypothetical protein CLV98_101215 [Dyadobacter jejuensis]|uniref:Uncharacterized protein n=1 Tax=Dyadobacter jejuensis TaxID=1082580 RepID=A0A316ATN8_9BACT|nr:hypothetical protein [Dyadobacter jejuensis]PWJ60040.1 hypothetical protein CLV98_101215 [Dyadobacter jejuensis]
MKNLPLSLGLLLLLGACNAKRLDNTKELSKEIKASQIKRVTNTQLIYTVDEWGKKIAQIAQKSLAKELEAHPEKAATLCKNLNSIPVLAALAKEYGVRMSLWSTADLHNPDLLPKELEMLKAYQYAALNNPTDKDNIQTLGDSLLLYNAPVPTDHPICNSCTPDDHFALWALVFDKKQIIRKLDAKQLVD